jgi:ribokinase/sulfofructose kinase
VITDGKHGAYGFDGEHLYHSKIFPGKLVEATGAGDSFATGFIGATMNNKTIQDALAWGCVNSSSVIGYVGPQKGLLSNREIIKRLKNKTNFKVKEI